MGTWGVTFSLGSLALLTFSLANSFDSMFFKYVLSLISQGCLTILHIRRVISTGLTFVVFTIWWVVAIPTLCGFMQGTLFDTSCLSTVPEDHDRRPLDCRQNEHGKNTQEKATFTDVGKVLEGQ